MPPKKKIKETRSDSNIFLVGGPSKTPLNLTKPLTNGDLVRYLHYLKNLDRNRNTSWDTLFSCALMSGTRSASCNTSGCKSGTEQDLCGIAYVKYTGCWIATGIPLKSDKAIKEQMSNLFKEWQGMNKKKARLSKSGLSVKDQTLVDNFVDKMKQTFLAASHDAEGSIMKDKLRDPKQKEEDI